MCAVLAGEGTPEGWRKDHIRMVVIIDLYQNLFFLLFSFGSPCVLARRLFPAQSQRLFGNECTSTRFSYLDFFYQQQLVLLLPVVVVLSELGLLNMFYPFGSPLLSTTPHHITRVG